MPMPLRSVMIFLIVSGLMALGILLAVRWTKATLPSRESNPPVEAVAINLAPVTVGPVTESVTAVGTLDANEAVMMRPEIAGLVRRVLFTEGQAVDEGTMIVELEDSELQAQVAQAAAQEKIARLTYDRLKRLVGQGSTVISAQQLDEAKSAWQAAEANTILYATRLKKTKIRAPFTGTLGIRRISRGDYVQPGQDLVNLEDLRTLLIDFKVPQTFLRRLSMGQPIRVETDAYPNTVFVGEVYAFDPRIEAASRAIRVRARVSNDDAKLRPGLFVTVTLVLGTNQHALLVPDEAVVQQGDRAFVYRVEDEIARWTEVSLGVRERGMVQVLDGLRANDQVVRAGQHRLRDGTRVSAK